MNDAIFPAPDKEFFLRKLPQVTLLFWVIKILATTLGETGGDAVSMSMGLGYAVGTLIFAALLVAVFQAQIRANTHRPWLYWGVIMATTTVGTTIADFVDRSLGVGYIGGSILLCAVLVAVILAWRRSCGSVSVRKIHSRKAETYYWITILCSSTLGTALGDYVADGSGLGYGGSAVIFSASLMAAAVLYRWTKISRSLLFWFAFILTRPLGAVLGDLLTKPHDHGGLDFSRIASTLILAAAMGMMIEWSLKKSRS